MSKLLDDIKMQFTGAEALYRLLLINCAVFLLITITRSVFFLAGADNGTVEWVVMKLSLPADLSSLLRQPWTLLTYMFLHTGLLHILFNMLILFWTGRLFTEYLGNAKLWATYVAGALVGALAYVISFNLLPAFDGTVSSSYLLGASAGVIAVLVAVATLLPDYVVHLLIFGAVRLKYVAIFSIVLYFISIPLGNAGGHIAHLGGALFGYLMIVQLRKGRDLTAWLTGLSAMKLRSKPVKMTVVKSGRSRYNSDDLHEGIASQELVDRILDKINKSGFDSLSKEEKEILYKASGKK
ncbi:MAG: rhomboid family intramembrane serine protease [Bacteroidetes bacterium]|nr:rhomboid family intramembrane serine protease [Bacteroidota bacterium]